MPQYSFSTFSYPGATSTYGYGVNDSGEVVGSYVAPASQRIDQGYIVNNGSFTSFNYPSIYDVNTEVMGIDAAGDFVGQGGFNDAFYDKSGQLTTLRNPSGSLGIGANAINETGTEIVGYYVAGRYRLGYTFSNGEYTTIAYPGYGENAPEANFTTINGVNAAGEIVGNTQGIDFYEEAGVYTQLNYPGAAATTANGINDAGDIVGSYIDTAGMQHGFVDLGGSFSTVDVPGGTNTAIYGINDAGELVGSADINGVDVAFTATQVVCFGSGTQIRVLRDLKVSDVAVERLVVGDLVLSGSGRLSSIRWVGHRTVNLRRNPRPNEVMPVRIAAHAIGVGLPARDLYISPGHAICLDIMGEVLIPAAALVNGSTIQKVEVDEITYWHVELEAHDVILAEGLPAESYLDMGNRGFFAVNAIVDLSTLPDPLTRTHSDFCRPFLDGGPLLQAVRARLKARANVLEQAKANASPARSAA